MEKRCVVCEVGTGLLYITLVKFMLKFGNGPGLNYYQLVWDLWWTK
jgi:hypothetical protein